MVSWEICIAGCPGYSSFRKRKFVPATSPTRARPPLQLVAPGRPPTWLVSDVGLVAVPFRRPGRLDSSRAPDFGPPRARLSTATYPSALQSHAARLRPPGRERSPLAPRGSAQLATSYVAGVEYHLRHGCSFGPT